MWPEPKQAHGAVLSTAPRSSYAELGIGSMSEDAFRLTENSAIAAAKAEPKPKAKASALVPPAQPKKSSLLSNTVQKHTEGGNQTSANRANAASPEPAKRRGSLVGGTTHGMAGHSSQSGQSEINSLEGSLVAQSVLHANQIHPGHGANAKAPPIQRGIGNLKDPQHMQVSRQPSNLQEIDEGDEDDENGGMHHGFDSSAGVIQTES